MDPSAETRTHIGGLTFSVRRANPVWRDDPVPRLPMMTQPPTARPSGARWLRLVRWLPVALLLAVVLPGAAPLGALAGGSGAIVYVHVSTTVNTAHNYTELDNPVTNNDPNAVVFVTPTWNPGGVTAAAFDYHQVGVYWQSGNHRWAIFNEDSAPMPAGAAFNVYALPAAGGGIFVHQATTANSAGDFTNIDSAYSNGRPAQQLIVTPSWNPGGAGGVYDAPPLG